MWVNLRPPHSAAVGPLQVLPDRRCRSRQDHWMILRKQRCGVQETPHPAFVISVTSTRRQYPKRSQDVKVRRRSCSFPVIPSTARDKFPLDTSRHPTTSRHPEQSEGQSGMNGFSPPKVSTWNKRCKGGTRIDLRSMRCAEDDGDGMGSEKRPMGNYPSRCSDAAAGMTWRGC